MVRNNHSDLVSEILLAYGADPRWRLWRNATGVARAYSGGQIVRYGLVGSPDIIGILSGGVFIGLECKTGNAVQSKEQKAFEKMILQMGGRYRVIRTVGAAGEFLEQESVRIHERLRTPETPEGDAGSLL
jgi:hypothetical protein